MPGLVAGRLSFGDIGSMVDCSKMCSSMSGIAIPWNIDRVKVMQSDALYIFLVERDSASMRPSDDRFYNRFPSITVWTYGELDVSIRLFLRKMQMELKLPVLALVNNTPHGLKMLSFYGRCENNGDHSTGLDIKWLGIRPSDLDKIKMPKECRLRMTEKDIKAVKKMMEEDFVKRNPGWVEELNLMVKTKKKVETEALCAFGLKYLTENYLPLKLQEKDWL